MAGAFLRKQKGDGQQGSLRAECRIRKGRKAAGQHLRAECRSKKGRKAAGQHLRAECRSKKGRKANRAAFEGRVP